jgi:hypothetical protein
MHVFIEEIAVIWQPCPRRRFLAVGGLSVMERWVDDATDRKLSHFLHQLLKACCVLLEQSWLHTGLPIATCSNWRQYSKLGACVACVRAAILQCVFCCSINLCCFPTNQVLALLPVTRDLLSKVKLGKKVRRMAESNELDTGSWRL